MPAILSVPANQTDTLQVQLTKEGLVIDSRVIVLDRFGWTFECTIEGDILTVRSIEVGPDVPTGGGWRPIYFRIYDPTVEEVPSFNSKSYRYFGLDNERPPYDVEEVIVDHSVRVIKSNGFFGCAKMKRCMMGDSVEDIEACAFGDCKEMTSLRLSRGLRFIRRRAFARCGSIECLFVPPTLEVFERAALQWCRKLKICVLPININTRNIGRFLASGCPSLLTDTNVQYSYDVAQYYNIHQVHQWLKHRYDHIPLFRLCADPDINATMIRNFISAHGTIPFYHTDDDHGLTPLHILTGYNDFADVDTIVACYSANPSALFARDREERTPLDMLWKVREMGIIVHMIQDLCINRR